MQTVYGSRLQKRRVAGAFAAVVTALGCSVGVIEHEDASPESEVAARPFWSSDSAGESLSVVQLYQSGAGWGADRPAGLDGAP